MNISNFGINTAKKNKSHWFTSRRKVTFRKIAEGDFSAQNSIGIHSDSKRKKEISTGTSEINKAKYTDSKNLLVKYNNNLAIRKKIESKISNSDSKNALTLTKEQINYLKNKYNIEDISSKEYENLISELKEMNMLSSDYVSNVLARPIPPGGFVMYGYDGYNPAFDFTSSNNYLSNLKNENARIETALTALNRGDCAFKCSSEEIFKYFTTQKSINNRLITLFEMLKKN